MHEIVHALGFFHEQSRPDRDDYVTIHRNNIIEDKLHNFREYPRSLVDTYNVPYDLRSIMHYESKAFSKNGENTITSKVIVFEKQNPRELNKYNVSTYILLHYILFPVSRFQMSQRVNWVLLPH